MGSLSQKYQQPLAIKSQIFQKNSSLDKKNSSVLQSATKPNTIEQFKSF